METDLQRLFQGFIRKTYENLDALPAAQRQELEQAFFAGAWSVLTTLPTASPGLAQQVALFAKQADEVADSLRQQCAAFATKAQSESIVPTPHRR